MALIAQAKAQLDANDVTGLVKTLEDVHTAEYEAALGSYKTAQSVTPDDDEVGPKVQGAEKKVASLALKRQGVPEMEARDFATAAGTFDKSLEQWPDNAEIKRLRDEAARRQKFAERLKAAQDALPPTPRPPTPSVKPFVPAGAADVKTKAGPTAVKKTADPKVVKKDADPKADGALFGAEVPRRPL
jgi:hypothetical protein